MKYLRIAVAVVLVGTAAGCAHVPGRVLIEAPAVLPNTTAAMGSSEFWLARVMDPDRTILDARQIAALNAETRDERGLVLDVTRSGGGSPDGQEVADRLNRAVDSLRGQVLFRASGARAGAVFFERMRDVMDLAALSLRMGVQYGLVARATDQRILPTEEGLYREKGDLDFDELQNSGLDIGTPVEVYHRSRDGAWLYGRTPLSEGWVRAADVALADRADVARYVEAEPFVVVTAAKAGIFEDPDFRDRYDEARMGTRLPLARATDGYVEVRLPRRGPDGRLAESRGYLRRESAAAGFLPYTPRVIMDQAFKMLNTPYGWGDMRGDHDCSRFIQEIFAVVGVMMPRNSGDQARVGRRVVSFSGDESPEDKARALTDHGLPGATILYMKGHIMVYVGASAGRPYAIHATWGYRDPCPDPSGGEECREVVRVLNRVVVSDLSLGEGSKKGSLLERLRAVQQVVGRDAL